MSNKTDAQKAIDELVKALNAGGYNCAPSEGHTLEVEPLDLTVDANGNFWPTPKKDENYPHKCPRCGGPAYIGLSKVDCKAKC